MELILIFAVLNVGLGYALAVTLADPPKEGLAIWQAWRNWRRSPPIRPGSPAAPGSETEMIQPAAQPAAEEPPHADVALPREPAAGEDFPWEEPAKHPPAIAEVEELPAAWRDLLESEQLSARGLADGVGLALYAQLAAYRQHALAAEARARLVLAQENADAVEQLVADFRFLHHEWLARLVEGAELLFQQRGRLSPAEDAGQQLESLLYDAAARMDSIDRAIGDIDYRTDVAGGCRRLLEEMLELASGVHLLRDDLAAALAAMLHAQGTLAALPHDQQLDPLTGRVNRLGLEASFRPSAAARQAVAIAWDGFGQVNERLGTRAGDRVLRTFSQLLADLLENVRTSAEIVRLAGTRFLLLLDGISREQAVGLAEQIRQSLEGVTLDWQGATLEFTARMGITTVEPGEELPALLARLELGLEAAELAGRNRCAIAEGKETRIVAPHQVPVIARRVEVEDGGQP